MGCFFACFGSSKDRKIRQRHKVQVQLQPRDNRNNGGFKQAQPNVFVAQKIPEIPITQPGLGIWVKPERQLSLSPNKKVTFDSNVTTYEPVPVAESIDFSVEKGQKEEHLGKQSQSQSNSENSSIISSSGSYPSNHRYQNCRDSDDDELDYEETDNDDDDNEEEDESGLDYDNTCEDGENLGLKNVSAFGLPESEVKLNANARDRSGYVHSVLNPVENLSQWKAVKAKETPAIKGQKENFAVNQEPRIKEKTEQEPSKSDREIAVDASLSNWLGSSESTPVNKPSSTGLGDNYITTPEKSSISKGSNSPVSFDDRPILGALTVEEIKQFSATSSPRKSPSRSPDDMPIIGTVGTYWNHSCLGKESGSVSSFKGIPNTTSKYREDKRVNWHSTPFETRLERALNGTSAC